MTAGEPQAQSTPPFSAHAPNAGWLTDVLHGLVAYYLTSGLAILGVLFGHDFLKPAPNPLTQRGDTMAALANWDGVWYVKIIEHGYRYDADRPSNIAFFPAFSLLGKGLADATGLRPDTALAVVAHLSLAGTFVFLAAYVRQRGFPNPSGWVLVAFGLWPTSFFFRMAYSESLFLFCAVAALYGMERRWPWLAIALLCGVATATRSVGVCLLLPFGLHLLRTATGWRDRAFGLALVPVACWGLLAFMAYQQWEFGDALAFARTQENWRVRPAVPWTARLGDLLTLEPVRSIFDPSSPCCWQRSPAEINPLFSLHCANPIYWLTAIALIGVGVWQRWLTRYEITLAIGLLLVPYALRGHEMCMAGMGRFTAVVFPVAIVTGHLLARLPAPVAAMLVGVGAFFMASYAALFAAWWRFF